MMDRVGDQGPFMLDEEQVQMSRWRVRAQECSMCGDVGFADQLHQCTRCHVRYQHTYCCNSKEGLRNGTWICDWCRLLKKNKTRDVKQTQSASVNVTCSVLSEDSAGLECLLKAALSEARQAAQTSSADGESLCSSSIESVKEDDASFGVMEAPSCSSEDRISQGEETMSAFPCALPRGRACDSKRNPKSVRCGMKVSQKRRQKSLLEQQCGSVQLKRLSSLKSSKTGIACDPPKSFVRRYKSLSDISF